MDILKQPILDYIKIVSKKYKIPQKKLKLLISDDWVYKISGEIFQENLYIDNLGNKYIVINKDTGLKLIY